MPTFVATFSYCQADVGPDLRAAHARYLAALRATGTLIAAGPIRDEPERSAMMIVKAESLEAAASALERGPVGQAGAMRQLSVRAWDPLHGELSHHSSRR